MTNHDKIKHLVDNRGYRFMAGGARLLKPSASYGLNTDRQIDLSDLNTVWTCDGIGRRVSSQPIAW